jgi:hypothetical protein
VLKAVWAKKWYPNKRVVIIPLRQTNQSMNKAAFNELVGVIDEAIDLAGCAVKAAELGQAKAQFEPVTLVKVAANRYHNVAKELIKTGTFRQYTAAGLAKTLENAGPADFLDIMEKLASQAVFPLDAETELSGDLVEKSAKTKTDDTQKNESKTDLWVRCCEESGISVRN